MIMTYLTQPPKKWTFEQPKLKEYVESWCTPSGEILNLFAGKVRLSENIHEVRVDLSEEFNPNVVMDAYEYVKMIIDRQKTTNTDCTYDTVILDPPYNLRKAREKYEGKYIGSFTKIKNILGELLPPTGRVITLGYDTVGMSKSRGFKKIAVCVICHNGDHNDTLCVVEEKL